jgi:hypothetical protein
MADPRPGEMVLYDDILPPLLDNKYRMTVQTDVAAPDSQELPAKDSFFNIEGPRFSLPATEVAGVFPPRNGHGPFHDSIPHVAIRRRTLPWEREMDPKNKIGTPTLIPGVPPPAGTVPWLALLLFEEGEYKLLQNVPLEKVVPSDVFADLGSPQNITCDAIEASYSLITSIMPSKEELQLLAHVRRVNKDDRELSIEGSDGYFAVVMGSRLPSEGAKCRACLVSIEQRSDLVDKDPPAIATSILEVGILADAVHPVEVGAIERSFLSSGPAIESHVIPGGGGIEFRTGVHDNIFQSFSARLVLLYSWQFQTLGVGTFRELMQTLDVGMIGKLENPGHPPLTDTCHLKVDLQDRAGVPEQVLYRGPLVPFELTRDPLGPYHSADQARRVNPETGAEDISYAGAFEAGRLLAAADPRLGQELMRWRREAYKQSSRADSVARVRSDMSMAAQIDLHVPVVPLLTAKVVQSVTTGAGPIADAFSLDKIKNVIGLNPDAVQKAFELPSREAAVAMLGGDAGALGATVGAPAQTPRSATTIDAVAADTAGLERLAQSRRQVLNNVAVKLGVTP